MRILFFCLVLPLVLLIFDIDIKINSVSTILGVLVGIAGAIFTIMSIWVAFLYPNVLKTLRGENLVNADFSAGGEDTTRLKQIVSVIIQSALVMIFAVLALLAAASLDAFSYKVRWLIQAGVQFLVVYLCCVQISALASTILINYSFIDILERHRKKRAKDHDA